MANKNKTKKPSQPVNKKKGNSNSLGFVKEALTLIGGLAGSILAVYGLVKTLKEDVAGFAWLIPVGIVIWLIILWRLFQIRKKAAYSLFVISMLIGVVGWIGWQSQVKATDDKVIVLVAQFDGPEEKYGLRRKIVEDLQETTQDYDDTVIIEGDKLVTSSEYARELGAKEKADLVIWAWYRPTENPNITVHIENLSPTDFVILNKSETYQPQATLAQLESFEIQRQLGSETSTLVSFLTGALRFESGDYQTVVGRFEKILEENDVSTFISIYDLYFHLGYAYQILDNYEQAIQNYDKAIELDPQSAAAYNNRGLAYDALDQIEYAIQDYNKAIELDPQSADAYNNRGIDYDFLDQTERAIQDYDMAIELDPQSAVAYNSRCLAYHSLGQDERAIEDCDKAVELEPEVATAYNARGVVFVSLEQYERAVQDYDKAIKLDSLYVLAYNNRGTAFHLMAQYKRAIQDFDKAIELAPQLEFIYNNRGATYYSLGQYELAIQDAGKIIELNPQNATAYYNRGTAYQQLGKNAEAEADFKKYEGLTGEKPPSLPSP